MKATAIAPSNIAFTKYWGKIDQALRIPENGSISMTLSNLLTTTTVEFSDAYQKDEITINDIRQEDSSVSRVIKHLDRVRKLAGIQEKARVVSFNDFPSGTGLSSSASGFAALTVAASFAASLHLSEKELSILARLGSGSACRSIPSGFVEWFSGDTNETSYAAQLFPSDYWSIADVVVIVSTGRKDVPTTEGQKKAATSPFLPVRVSHMPKKNEKVKEYIKVREFDKFGELIEAEALELHAMMLTQNPPLIYWLPGTVLMMKLVQKWRREGLPVYFTLNTGQDVHLICQKKDVDILVRLIRQVGEAVKKIIVNTPSRGAYVIQEHLF